MIKALVAAFILALPSFCWAETKSFSDFSGGLNTRQSSVLIQENESPDLQNVVLDEAGAITRRKGYTKLNSAAIGGGLSDVNSIYQLEKSNGDKFCVAFSSTNGYYSTNGCNTFTTFISTLTRNNDVNCDPYADRLYCVNNQYDFYFDGANDIAFAGPANANYIRAWRNRCFAAGTDANPSRLYWSDLGDCNTWNALSYVDIDAEDGDVITGLGPDLFNFLPVYKKFSTYLIQFDNANTANRKVINVSRTTGAKNHRAVAGFNNRQYFMSVGSNGGQPGVYSTDGIMMEESSGKIRSEIEGLSNFFSNSGRKILDTKSDFDSGTFDPRAMSSLHDPGFMQSSYSVKTDTLNSDFATGSSSSIPHTGYYANGTLSAGVALVNSGFEDGGIINGWARLDGSGIVGPISNSGLTANTDWSIGTYGAYQAICGTGNTRTVSLYVIDGVDGSTIATRLLTGTVGNSYSGVLDLSVAVSTVIRINANNALLSSTFSMVSPIPYSIILVNGGALCTGFDYAISAVYDFPEPFHARSSTYTSGCYDTRISTPIWGPVTISMSSATSRAAAFSVAVATSCSGVFDTPTPYTPGSILLASAKPAVKYITEFTNSITTTSAEIYNISIPAASTGVWTSPETLLSNTVATWGTLQATEVKTGVGAITYAIKASTYVGGTAYAPWKTLASGDTISVDTGAYVVVRATFSVYSASETAKLDSLVINWNEGTSAKSATMAVYKNRLHFCGQTAAGTYNDVCYVLDTKGAWTRWTGVNARHLNVVNQNFTAASSTEASGGYAYKLYDSDSDDGNGISAYWTSKDHPLGNIQNRKAIDRFFVVGSPNATTLTSTIQADTGLRSLGYDIDFSTGMGFKISHKPVQGSINGNVFRMKFSNTEASKPWSVLGYGLQYRDLGLGAP